MVEKICIGFQHKERIVDFIQKGENMFHDTELTLQAKSDEFIPFRLEKTNSCYH